MDKQALETIAQNMVAAGKGILAADESTGTIKKRFDTISVESTETNRRDYREMLFSTQDAMANYISGVILFDETIRQQAESGAQLVEIIQNMGCLPGIKVDTGAKELANHAGEKVTEGLDGLRERLQEYVTLGAKFAKWRAVIHIENNRLPSRACLVANTHALARYAGLCQENGLVPIVEPEVIMDGAHNIERCFETTAAVLHMLYEQLKEQSVHLEGTILKPNMVLSGTQHPNQAGIEQVAEMTLDCLTANVPQTVPGIVFLSGGQSDIDATAHLDAINRLAQARSKSGWKLSFSYGRALQAPVLQAWGGKTENRQAAQVAFTHRAKMNGLATLGQWEGE